MTDAGTAKIQQAAHQILDTLAQARPVLHCYDRARIKSSNKTGDITALHLDGYFGLLIEVYLGGFDGFVKLPLAELELLERPTTKGPKE
jgi:hypothetical protein